MKDKLSYGEAIEELNKITEILQSDNCKIDDLKKHTQRAAELLKFCKEQLCKTDEEVKKLLEDIEND